MLKNILPDYTAPYLPDLLAGGGNAQIYDVDASTRSVCFFSHVNHATYVVPCTSVDFFSFGEMYGQSFIVRLSVHVKCRLLNFTFHLASLDKSLVGPFIVDVHLSAVSEP